MEEATKQQIEAGWTSKRIELLQKIGNGSYGEVWIGRLQANSEVLNEIQYVAVKIELKSSSDISLKKEYEVMKIIGKHPNLIEYFEYANNFTEEGEDRFKGKSYLAL